VKKREIENRVVEEEEETSNRKYNTETQKIAFLIMFLCCPHCSVRRHRATN